MVSRQVVLAATASYPPCRMAVARKPPALPIIEYCAIQDVCGSVERMGLQMLLRG